MDHKALRKARYERRYARHTPAKPSAHYPAELRMTASERQAARLNGVPELLQQFVRMTYGPKGAWRHECYKHGTKKGPGRRPLGWTGLEHPPGTKLVKRFIRDSRKEQTAYRATYHALTGEHYHERYS